PESVVGSIFPADLDAGAETRLRSPDGVLTIPVARSDQGTLALEIRPAPGARLALEGYARNADRLVLVAPRSGEPFSLGSFAVARGVSVEAALSAARYGIVASYGYQDLQVEHGDSAYVPQHGTRHLFQGGVIVYPRATLSIRVGLEGAWGRRTTIADGAFEWE